MALRLTAVVLGISALWATSVSANSVEHERDALRMEQLARSGNPPLPGKTIAMFCQVMHFDKAKKVTLFFSVPFRYKIPMQGNYWDAADKAFVKAVDAKYGIGFSDPYATCRKAGTLQEANEYKQLYINDSRRERREAGLSDDIIDTEIRINDSDYLAP